MRSVVFAAMVLFGFAGVAEAQVQVRISAPVRAVAVAPGATLGGRTVERTEVDPACLVTRGPNGYATAQFIVPRTRIGEYAAVMTPAFGRCARPQNPYRARIVMFSHAEQRQGSVVFRRGSLACRFEAGSPNQAVCNRPLRCDLAHAKCVNP